MNCKNCGHRVDGNFCSHCGQGSKVGRINLPGFLQEVSGSIFQIDKGFFYTLKELFVRPGPSLKDFLNGKRKNHFKPIAYVLTLATVYFLIVQITNQSTWMDDLISGWMEGALEKDKKAKVPAIITWCSANYAYSTLLLLPVFSLASYLSFLKFEKNYLEHVVINAYITGQQAIFYALFAIAGSFIESDFVEMFSVLVTVSYTFWVFWQFFSEGSRITNILRSVLTYLLYFLFSSVLLIAVLGVSHLLK